ncbi:MAG: ATP-dependent DNA helicase [Nitrososphaeraceae archaeon]
MTTIANQDQRQDQSGGQMQDLTLSNLVSNFPFKEIRPKQLEVLQQIADAINARYKYIVLEAPTGFGKSPVAIAVGRTLGTSYICSATKDLQTQYTNDFPYLRAIKGMGNYDCLVKEDFVLEKTYQCAQCKTTTDNYRECRHRNVVYGPCRDGQPGFVHVAKDCDVCSGKDGFHDGCRYRTYLEDYEVAYPNTDKEEVSMSFSREAEYRVHSTLRDGQEGWMHLANIFQQEALEKRSQFTPCPYYDQLNKGRLASHTIFNYANFLIFIKAKKIGARKLLVLDEGHQIENQLIEDVGISVTKKILQKYIATDLLEYTKFTYDDNIETTWLKLLASLYNQIDKAIADIETSEIKIDAKQYLQRLEDTIDAITEDHKNWIVSEIIYDDEDDNSNKINVNKNRKVTKVTFKPLNVAPYCKKLFEQCDTTLIMSATILDFDTFCSNVGLDPSQVKFIELGSDFPVENRPIHQLNTAYLNYNSLHVESVQRSIADAIDKIMDLHSNDKGIIHTTSYAQVRFIERLLSRENKRRLISTDPEIPRDEIIAKHWDSTTSTRTGNEKSKSVLISPSLHTGLDLKDDQSRFQIVVKIPYPSRADRWIETKRKLDGGKWYNWQTALRLVQCCGRSIRSKDDWAKTYILDSAFSRFIRENKLPAWFREGII